MTEEEPRYWVCIEREGDGARMLEFMECPGLNGEPDYAHLVSPDILGVRDIVVGGTCDSWISRREAVHGMRAILILRERRACEALMEASRVADEALSARLDFDREYAAELNEETEERG